MPETAVYVYCIVSAGSRPSARRAPSGLPGAARPSVEGLGHRLWLVVAAVPLETYGPGQLETALKDMQWVGRVALAHEAVVEHFARAKGATVVPAKLFTMFSTLDRAVADTRSRRGDIRDALRRIVGCEEWGVRIVRVPERAPARAARSPSASGAAFLAAKKRARDAKIESVRAALDAAHAVYDRLSALARDARRRDDAPDAATMPPLLDAAFLVPTGRRARFKSAARRAAAGCAQSGAAMTLSGPWPAYNFVQPPEAGR
jgi:hypothetical protein